MVRCKLLAERQMLKTEDELHRCQEAGVLGALAGIIGTIQASEALKLVLDIGHPLTDRLLDFDATRTGSGRSR